MLAFLGGKTSHRKLRLSACACCRDIWHLLSDERSRKAVGVAERFSDGLATEDELVAVRAEAWDAVGAAGDQMERNGAGAVAKAVTEDATWDAMPDAAICAANAAAWNASKGVAGKNVMAFAAAKDAGRAAAKAKQALLLRDIFGNPFRHPPKIDSTWLTSDALALAQITYEDTELRGGELDFARLAVLAETLEDAGCTDQQILSHLRGPGPHIRGCHVLDALLGKS